MAAADDSPSYDPARDPFAAVHRSARRRAVLGAMVSGLAVSAVVAFAWVVPSHAAPSHAASPLAIVVDAAAAVAPADAAGFAGGTALVAPAPPGTAAAPPPPAPIEALAAGDATPQHPIVLPAGPNASAHDPAGAVPPASGAPEAGTGAYAIGIDATGYQVELDECLWVRMDIGAIAPIVGAHNTCGGDVVLGMAVGDTVHLTGEELDGAYVVVGSRDALKGQDAFQATDGMGATVILQTCHWEGDGVRLVALVPAV